MSDKHLSHILWDTRSREPRYHGVPEAVQGLLPCNLCTSLNHPRKPFADRITDRASPFAAFAAVESNLLEESRFLTFAE
jgi:hypothetical protein